MESITQIKFPILLRIDRRLYAMDKSVIEIWGIRHEKGNVFSYKGSSRGKEHGRFFWLIGADGLFREITTVGYDREWAGFLRRIITLVRVRCEIAPGRQIKVGELKSKIRTLQRSNAFSNEQDLLSFLEPFADDVLFERELFSRYVGESNPADSCETFP